MLRGHDIVCFANDWQSDPTSKKHILSRLARHNRVLWVNSIGCRTPRVSGRDLRRFARKGRELLRGVEPAAPNLWTLSPLAIPFHGARAARALNRLLLAAHVRHAARRLGFRDFITWTFVPSSAPVAGRLGERLLVYHCVDEFAQFSGVDTAAMLALEEDLARRADLVLVTAARLLDAKRRHNPHTHLVRHGVDVELFGRALDADLASAADLAGAPRPVLGFFGLLADWVDVDLLTRLARARPHWTFAFVGPVETDVAALAALPNVRLLGRRRYEELPAYCKGFDAALLPFRINELTLAANPLKLREYLAAGLPVVSSRLPEVEALGAAALVAASDEEWLACCERALAEGAGPRRERAAAMRDESWDAKVEEMSALVERRLAECGTAVPRRSAELLAAREAREGLSP
jgi:glycosyltransferase involved in cell wall biosynthesis